MTNFPIAILLQPRIADPARESAAAHRIDNSRMTGSGYEVLPHERDELNGMGYGMRT